MKSLGPGLQDGIHVTATVAALGGVVERSLDLEFLDYVGIGQGNVGRLRHVVIGRADALDQIVIVVLTLAIHDHADVAAAELGGSVQLTLRAGRQRQQLLEVLSRQRKLSNGLRFDGLAGVAVVVSMVCTRAWTSIFSSTWSGRSFAVMRVVSVTRTAMPGSSLPEIRRW